MPRSFAASLVFLLRFKAVCMSEASTEHITLSILKDEGSLNAELPYSFMADSGSSPGKPVFCTLDSISVSFNMNCLSMKFDNSRILPGQGIVISERRNSLVACFLHPYFELSLSMKSSARDGISSLLSLRGGIFIEITFSL